MSLFKTGDSNGEIFLEKLFNGKETFPMMVVNFSFMW